MAKAKKTQSKRAKKPSKVYAVQRHIQIGGLGSALSTSNVNIVDVPMFLSKVNHRLYRQSKRYRCKINLTDIENRAGGLATVYVLRDTWFLQAAYDMAFKEYQKNTAEERANTSKTQMARWQDFRIALQADSGVTYNSLNPIVTGNNPLTETALANGEFELSRVAKEDGTTMTFGLFGLANSRWGILQEYDRSANTNDDPANPQTNSPEGAYSGLDDDHQDAIAEHIRTAGNSPPYDANSLDANFMFRKVGKIGTSTDGIQKLTTGFFDAPLGCILIVAAAGPNALTGEELELEVQAGDYKGVHGARYINV